MTELAKPGRGVKRPYSLLALFIMLVLVIIVGVWIGSVDIPFMTTLKILLSRLPFVNITPAWEDSLAVIILESRLPRVMLAGIVGAALSMAGATYQGLFHNPLADPYLLGIAQGAALGAVIGFMFPGQGNLVPLFAFAGALLSVAIVYALAGRGMSLTTLVLAGVALGAFLGAIVSFLTITSGQTMRGILFWLSGSLALSQWSEFEIVLPVVLVGGILLILFSRHLNIMQLDEAQAKALGVNVEKERMFLIIIATMITAASVSFTGIIGFVGIIIPHAVRLIWGPDYRFLLPLSFLSGAIFLILADLVARTVGPGEIPIGVITALCGAPFFLYLLHHNVKAIL